MKFERKKGVNISSKMNSPRKKAPFESLKAPDLDNSIEELTDEKIMEAIYSNYRDYIYTIIQNKCRYFKLPNEDVEDCFIEVIIKLSERGCRKIRQFKGKSSFKTFLTVQCRNMTTDFIRKETKNRERFKLVETFNDDLNEIFNLYNDKSHRDNPESQYLSKEKEAQIQEAHKIINDELDKLNDKDKTMAVLRLQKNMTYREIDEFLGIENCRYRLSKIIQNIRSKIDNKISIFKDW